MNRRREVSLGSQTACINNVYELGYKLRLIDARN